MAVTESLRNQASRERCRRVVLCGAAAMVVIRGAKVKEAAAGVSDVVSVLEVEEGVAAGANARSKIEGEGVAR